METIIQFGGGAELLELVEKRRRMAELALAGQIARAKTEAERKRLIARREELEIEINQEANALAAKVRERLAMQFSKPNPRQRLKEMLRNPKDQLGKRELERIWKNLAKMRRH